jgi:hypothetical protein
MCSQLAHLRSFHFDRYPLQGAIGDMLLVTGKYLNVVRDAQRDAILQQRRLARMASRRSSEETNTGSGGTSAMVLSSRASMSAPGRSGVRPMGAFTTGIVEPPVSVSTKSLIPLLAGDDLVFPHAVPVVFSVHEREYVCALCMSVRER